MMRVYDIEVLPCTFFEEPAADESTNSALFNRKRTTTVELKNLSKMINGSGEQQAASAYFNASFRLRPKWIGESQRDTDETISVSKKTYESLLGSPPE